MSRNSYDDDEYVDDDRRSFASRTPVNNNPDKVTYRRAFVTRHQVTGWRFLNRRIASGVAMHDTRMLVDPLRSQSRAVVVGGLIVVTGLLGCLIFSFIRPNGNVGNSTVLADRDSSALYVRVNDQLHPVANLTSARLITGKADNPTQVRASALDEFPRGSQVGIPGAPERMVQNPSRDAHWTVCEGAGPTAGITVVGGPIATGGEKAAPLADDQAVLVSLGAGETASTWLLWNGKRSPIDLADQAVTSALGVVANTASPRPIATGLFNAIPEGAPLRAPTIPNEGAPTPYPLSVAAPIGAVAVSYASDNTLLHYAVLEDGLQPISPVFATLLRNTNSHGFAQPPRLGADEIAKLPVSRFLDTSAFPDTQIELADATSDPVTCVNWTKPADAAASSSQLLSGSALPIAEDVRPVTLVGAGPESATRVALPVGTGYFAQTVGQEPASPTAGSLFWIADTGVRNGIEAANADELAKTVSALGLTAPATPVPWSVLTLFTPGPALSKADALTAYSGTENR